MVYTEYTVYYSECLVLYYRKSDFQNLTLTSVDGESDGDIITGSGMCFDDSVECRYI